MSANTIYDDVPYPSYAFPQTSPDRLATIASLFGLETVRPKASRVLELGCGDGTNLLSHAFLMPASKFVGLDLSETHIQTADRTKAELAADNATFQCLDLMDLQPEKLGEFDFIISHGLFSWVPAHVRDRILEIYRTCLKRNGVGYISYNVLPGCRSRESVWDMIRYHTRGIQKPGDKISAAREFAEFAAEFSQSKDAFKNQIRSEVESLRDRPDANVLHDDLSDCNTPYLFSDFAALLSENALQFLAEADPISLGDGNLPSAAADHLDKISDGDVIKREQYLDFLEFARFRSSLICHRDIRLDRSLDGTRIVNMLVSTNITIEQKNFDLSDTSPVKFKGLRDVGFSVNHPLTKTALVRLIDETPRGIKFRELVADSAERIGVGSSPDLDDQVGHTAAFFLQLFMAGYLSFSLFEPPIATFVDARPEASRFARWQLRNGSQSVSTLSGRNIAPEFDAVRTLLNAADGTRTVDDIVDEVLKERGRIEGEDAEQIRQETLVRVHDNLYKMMKYGLLVAK